MITNIFSKKKYITIGNKLKIANAAMLFFPLLLSSIAILLIYLFFITGASESEAFLNYIKKVETKNSDYAYTAMSTFVEEYKKQILETGDDDFSTIFSDEMIEKSCSYIYIEKNGDKLYEENSISQFDDENIIDFFNISKSIPFGSFSIIGDDIIFKEEFQVKDNNYRMYCFGKTRSFNSTERDESYYINFFIINAVLVLIVILLVYIMGRFLYSTIFKRVEYSLNVLNDGVNRISAGELDYRINYDRNDEFLPLCNEFNRMAQYLQDSTEKTIRDGKIRKEIIMSFSHDVFSPLTSIKAYIEGLQSGIATTPETQKKYLETINKKAIQIEKMMSQMLLYSKLEYGENNIIVSEINISEFTENFIEEYCDDNQLGNTVITSDIEKDISILAEPSSISSVFLNLIENSKKYNDKDECRIHFSIRKIDKNCIIEIADNGPGVPESSLQDLFNIFYRSDKARASTEKGSGIGLSIVSNIITKQFKGSVHAENVPDGGLRIVISIPIQE